MDVVKYAVHGAHVAVDGLDRVVKDTEAFTDLMSLTYTVAAAAVYVPSCGAGFCQGLADRISSQADCVQAWGSLSGAKFFLSGQGYLCWQRGDYSELVKRTAKTTSGVAFAVIWAVERQVVQASRLATSAANSPLLGRVTVLGVKRLARGVAVVGLAADLWQLKGVITDPRNMTKADLFHLVGAGSSIVLNVCLVAGVVHPLGMLCLGGTSAAMGLAQFLSEGPNYQVRPFFDCDSGSVFSYPVRWMRRTCEGVAELAETAEGLERMAKLVNAAAGVIIVHYGAQASGMGHLVSVVKEPLDWFKLRGATGMWNLWLGRMDAPESQLRVRVLPHTDSRLQSLAKRVAPVKDALLTGTVTVDVLSFAQKMGAGSVGVLPLASLSYYTAVPGLSLKIVTDVADRKMDGCQKVMKVVDGVAKIALLTGGAASLGAYGAPVVALVLAGEGLGSLAYKKWWKV